MCELHYFGCLCGNKWLVQKKLASCESTDPRVKCADSLCMYVGSLQKPQRGECDICRNARVTAEAAAIVARQSLQEGTRGR